LDARSLQDMGDEALGLATKLSAGTPGVSGNRIFFDLAQRLFIQIPLGFGIVCLLMLLVAFAALAWRRGSLIRGGGVAVVALLAAGVLAWVALEIIGLIRSGTY